VNGISGGRTDAIEMRDEPSTDGGICKVAFHHAELALSDIFPLIKFDALAFYCLELALMRPIPINVSDNTRVFEIYDGVVDEESGSGGGMKNVEVVVFDPRAIEIGRGMRTCVKGNGIFEVTLLASSHEMSVDPNLSEGDVMSYLILSIFIEEDKGVLLRITAIVLAPSWTWMIGVVDLCAKLGNIGDGAGCRREGNSGVIHSESHWLFALNIIVCHVALNFVKNLRDKEKVFDGGIVTKGGGEDLVVKLSVPQNVDCWEEILRPC